MITMKERLAEAIARVRRSNPDLSDDAVAKASLAIVAFDCGHKAGMACQDVDMAREAFFLRVLEANRSK